MPLVALVPTTKEVEDSLAEVMPQVRTRIKSEISDVSGFPKNDVLVNLHRCPYRDSDDQMSDIVFLIDTCPHEELEASSNGLIKTVAHTLAEFGLTSKNGAEVWMRFLPGPWLYVHDDEIINSIKHPRN